MKILAANVFVLLLAFAQARLIAAPTTLPTPGMEAQVQIHLPGTPLEAKPVTEKAPLLLRIASATVGKNGGFYDLRYIGLVPGNHDLKSYLVRTDGSSMEDVPAIPVRVAHLLPEDHQGQLVARLERHGRFSVDIERR